MTATAPADPKARMRERDDTPDPTSVTPEVSVQQREQLAEVPLACRLVVHGRIGHRVAVERALVQFRAVGYACFVESLVQDADLLGGHVRVLVGVAEVHLGLELTRGPMRTVRGVGHQSSAVEAAK